MGDRFTSPREIAALNVAHYGQLLQTSLDEQTRTTVQKLLREEEARLARLPEGESPAPGRCAKR